MRSRSYLPLNVESSHCSVKSRTAPAMSDGRAATLHLVGGSAPQTRRARPESTAVVMRRPACVRGNLPWTECRANADPTTAITAAICVPRGGQLVPLGAGADLRWWGGLRGLNPQPSEPQSDGRQPCVVAAPGKGTTTLPQPVCPPTYQQTLSASVTVEYSVH